MSDKSTEKVTKQLELPNVGEARELVQSTIIPDINGETVLLDKLAGVRQTKTNHAIQVLRTIGCIADETDESGQTVPKWTNFPKWTTGKVATFADISRHLVPNPDGWVYIGTNREERKNPASLHKSGECDKCDKVHETGELDYSDLVDKVANSLKMGANAAGRTSQTKKPSRAKPESDKSDKAGEAPKVDEVLESVGPDEVVKSVILPTLAREVTLLDSGESDILPDTMTNLYEACKALVSAHDRANPAKQDKPVTRRRTPAKR